MGREAEVTDLEAGRRLLDNSKEESPFDIISTKNASIEELKRWRENAIFLNASRGFRYTLNLNKEEEKNDLLATIRAARMHTKAIQEANCFKEAAKPGNNTSLSVSLLPTNSLKAGDVYGIGPEELASITRDQDIIAVQQFGGVEGLSVLLKTDLLKGPHGDDKDLLTRRAVFGSNSYPRKYDQSFLRFLWEACHDMTLIGLLLAAAASLVLGKNCKGIKEGQYDWGNIAFAVLFIIVVTAVSDYIQSLRFRNLNEQQRNILLEVVRGGRRIEVSIFDIVVGDVVPLKVGDQVVADGIFISGYSLAIDESYMTGTSMIVHKNSKSPFLMSGCKVADGYGFMLVTSVGMNTEWGMLMAGISEDNGEETPLQVRLNKLMGLGCIVAMFEALLLFGLSFMRLYDATPNPFDRKILGDVLYGATKSLIDAVALVFIGSFEGLSLLATSILAYSVRKLMAEKALVRRFSACESMGCATTICCDKTGTLTLNQMTVVEAYVCGQKIDPVNSNLSLSPLVCSLLIEGIAQNTTGSVFVSEVNGGLEVFGSPTEKAILKWGLKLGMSFDDARSSSIVILAVPFDVERRRGGVALKLPDSQVHVHWMGSADTILAYCSGYINESNDVVQMYYPNKVKFLRAVEDMAANGLHCVAIAYRSLELTSVPTNADALAKWALPKDDLILLALVGIKDPCREGIKDAVQQCQHAGVKVRIVTGDNLKVARAIALECGILNSNADATSPILIEGKAFRNLSDAQRVKISDKISVMGRASPTDKLLLVQALQKRGDVVAVTGAWVNDAPALQEADIGLAMGVQGTQVAKDSSDIIILDDNFASIVKVMRWGRSFQPNIQKFIQLRFTLHLATPFINIASFAVVNKLALNTVQLLWVNLVVSTLGAIALVTEPPTDDVMRRPPIHRREPVILRSMWRNIFIQFLYQTSVLLVLNFWGESILNLEHDSKDHTSNVKNTMMFNVFFFCQIFNEFNARRPNNMNIFEGIACNDLFMGIVAISVILHVVIILFFEKFTSTVQLSLCQWLISIVIGLVSWPVAVLGKLIPVREDTHAEHTKKTYGWTCGTRAASPQDCSTLTYLGMLRHRYY